MADELTSAGHYAATQISVKREQIGKEWQDLTMTSASKLKQLEEAYSLQRYKRSAGDAASWIAKHALTADRADVGADLEGLEVLQKEFEEFQDALKANENKHVVRVNDFALELVSQAHPEAETIQSLRSTVSESWEALQVKVAARQTLLSDALAIHTFNTEADEAIYRIGDKDKVLSQSDKAVDLAGVEQLRRKHNALERELKALQERVSKLETEATGLYTTHPGHAKAVESKLATVTGAWTKLRAKSDARQTALSKSHAEQKFLVDFGAYMAWATDTAAQIKKEELAKDVSGAAGLLLRHRETQGKIEAKGAKFDELVKAAEACISQGLTGVVNDLEKLKDQHADLGKLWADRQHEFKECDEYTRYRRNTDRIEAWVAVQEGVLETNDVGDSLDSVEALMKKQEDFEKSLKAQREKVTELENYTASLVKSGHYETSAIEAGLRATLKRRSELDKKCADRRAQLESSVDLQVFLRDADEMQTSIAEKLKTASDESYRVLSNLRGKLQRHQAFEQELRSNEALVEKVNVRGKELADGGHFASDAIVARLVELNAAWVNLRAVSADKAQKLKEADDQQQFNHGADDIDAWCVEVERLLSSTDFGDSLTSVGNLLKRHDRLQSDIETYGPKVKALAGEAEALVAGGHFQETEIKARLSAIEVRYAALEGPSADRARMLGNSLALQQFYRDVSEEEVWINYTTLAIDSASFGDNPIAVGRLQKKHDDVQAEMTSRDKKITELKGNATALVDKREYSSDEASEVGKRIGVLGAAWATLGAKAATRKQNLADSLETQEYFANVGEVEAIIAEKKPLVESTDYGKDEDSAESLLNKHDNLVQDLQSGPGKKITEYAAVAKVCKDPLSPGTTGVLQVEALHKYSATRPVELSVSKGEVLEVIASKDADWWKVKRNNESGYVPASYLKAKVGGEVARRQARVEALYAEVTALAAKRRTLLDDSKKMHELNREIHEVESWMTDREQVAQVEELGNDLEHNEAISKKFNDFLVDLSANRTRVSKANDLGTKFISEGHSEAAAIAAQLAKLNERWDALQHLSDDRAKLLLAAQEVHRFDRDVAETLARFAEKTVVVSSDDFGNDLGSVALLLKKHENQVTRELANVIAVKVGELQTESTRLAKTQPNRGEHVMGKQAEIDITWEDLQAAAAARQKRLEDSKKFQTFLKEYRELSSWISGVHSLASSDELAKDTDGADELLRRHEELQAEIDARGNDIVGRQAFGAEVVTDGVYSNEVQEQLDQLEADLSALKTQMAARKSMLDQCAELQAFNRMTEQADAWIAAAEPALQSDDTAGASLDTIEGLLKKHTEFETSVVAQTEKIAELLAEASRLSAAGHYDAAGIMTRQSEVQAKWAAMQQLSNARKAKLTAALELQQFLRDTDEAEGWMNEKLQTAMDPSYKDQRNLHGKVQKHEKFQAEVAANQQRIFGVMEHGNTLISKDPSNTDLITARVAKLKEVWALLGAESEDKAQKLREAKNQHVYNHGVEDLEFWLSQTERLVANKELGKDLATVQSLQKKHGVIEADIIGKQGRFDDVVAAADDFIAQGHFDAANILSRKDLLTTRYTALKSSSATRAHDIAESLVFQQCLRDLDDEESWIQEKERLASSVDCGKDLTGVQNMLKKHAAFETEITTHADQGHATVVAAAAALVARGHYEADAISHRRAILESLWQELCSKSATRKTNLEAALKFQELATEMYEEVAWIVEKQAAIAQDIAAGMTVAGVEGLIRKHAEFEPVLRQHEERVAAMCSRGRSLVAEGNTAASTIQLTSDELQAELQQLKSLTGQRKIALGDKLDFLQCEREAENVLSWIADKRPQAASADVGKDMSSAEALLTKHQAFHDALHGFKTRVSAFDKLQGNLAARPGADASGVTKLGVAVETAWHGLITLSDNRKAQLLESREKFQALEKLHLEFAKMASQFNSWFENAEEDLTDPVRVNSLDEIHGAKAEHAAFMASLRTERAKFSQLIELDQQITGNGAGKNPYTWFTVDGLQKTWGQLDAVIADREDDLVNEEARQKENEDQRIVFAKHANTFASWLTDTRAHLVEGSGSLEDQLQSTQLQYDEILAKKSQLKTIEELGARMEEALILDNKHTDHSTVGLAQQWDQLEQLGMRMQHNLEQQIAAKNASGVSEEQLREFEETFRHFDKDNSQMLDHLELKSCLRSLGYHLPVVEEGEKDPIFEGILKQVDPNGDGYVSLNEFRDFMIRKESSNVESSADVAKAFGAAAGDKPYITADELRKTCTPEQADYCIRHMRPYIDNKGIEVGGGYDYTELVKRLFGGVIIIAYICIC